MHPLGTLRCRILVCMGADNPRSAAFFDPPADQSISKCLYQHLLRLHQTFADDPYSRIFVAAGLLSFGNLAVANEILHYLPRSPIVMDQAAGWCPLVPYEALATLLPVPEQYRNVKRWIEGSAESAAVERWLVEQGERLRWDPAAERFVLASPQQC